MKLDKKWIDKYKPCSDGVEWLKAQDDKDGVRVIQKLIDENKLNWANWAIVTIMTRKQYLAYAIYAAEQVIDIYEKEYPDDKRPREAIKATKAVLKNNTKRNCELARDASSTAANAAAWSAWSAWAAGDTASAAASAASSAAWAAARDAASAAASAAWAAGDTARGAAMMKKILMHGLKLLK